LIRELLILSLIFFVIIGFVYKVPIQLTAKYDPPSIYNLGGGGYSILYTLLVRAGYLVNIVYDTNQLSRFDPSRNILILASPDKTLSEEDTENILKWVSAGGYVFVLDEIGTVNTLTKRVDATIGYIVPEVTQGECVYSGKIYRIFLNKYSPITTSNISDPSVIGYCYTKDSFVGLFKRVGSGALFIIGDSSLFINTMMRTGYAYDNLILLRDIIGDRGVIFYEGGREYAIINTEAFFLVFGGLIEYLSTALKNMISRDPFMSLLLLTLIISIASLYYLRDYLGSERIYPAKTSSLYRVDKSILSRRYEKWVLKKK